MQHGLAHMREAFGIHRPVVDVQDLGQSLPLGHVLRIAAAGRRIFRGQSFQFITHRLHSGVKLPTQMILAHLLGPGFIPALRAHAFLDLVAVVVTQPRHPGCAPRIPGGEREEHIHQRPQCGPDRLTQIGLRLRIHGPTLIPDSFQHRPDLRRGQVRQQRGPHAGDQTIQLRFIEEGLPEIFDGRHGRLLQHLLRGRILRRLSRQLLRQAIHLLRQQSLQCQLLGKQPHTRLPAHVHDRGSIGLAIFCRQLQFLVQARLHLRVHQPAQHGRGQAGRLQSLGLMRHGLDLRAPERIHEAILGLIHHLIGQSDPEIMRTVPREWLSPQLLGPGPPIRALSIPHAILHRRRFAIAGPVGIRITNDLPHRLQ